MIFNQLTQHWKFVFIWFCINISLQNLLLNWILLTVSHCKCFLSLHKNCWHCPLCLLSVERVTWPELTDQMGLVYFCKLRPTLLHEPTMQTQRTDSLSCDKQVLGKFMTWGADPAEIHQGCRCIRGWFRAN